MSLRYGKSYPPKRIEDNRSRFEQEKDHDWDTIQLMRHMLFFGSPHVTKEEIKHYEEYFKKRYGETVDNYKGGKNETI